MVADSVRPGDGQWVAGNLKAVESPLQNHLAESRKAIDEELSRLGGDL